MRQNQALLLFPSSRCLSGASSSSKRDVIHIHGGYEPWLRARVWHRSTSTLLTLCLGQKVKTFSEGSEPKTTVRVFVLQNSEHPWATFRAAPDVRRSKSPTVCRKGRFIVCLYGRLGKHTLAVSFHTTCMNTKKEGRKEGRKEVVSFHTTCMNTNKLMFY